MAIVADIILIDKKTSLFRELRDDEYWIFFNVGYWFGWRMNKETNKIILNFGTFRRNNTNLNVSYVRFFVC